MTIDTQAPLLDVGEGNFVRLLATNNGMEHGQHNQVLLLKAGFRLFKQYQW